jgi:hypothetical protein
MAIDGAADSISAFMTRLKRGCQSMHNGISLLAANTPLFVAADDEDYPKQTYAPDKRIRLNVWLADDGVAFA